MPLDPCVKSVLCTLGVPVLNALDTLVQSYIVAIDLQLAAISTHLTSLQIQLIPVNAFVDLATVVLEEAKSVTNFIPVRLMEGCADMGDIMQDINGIVDADLASLRDQLTDAVRITAIETELQAIQNELNTTSIEFTELRTLINECVVQNQ